MNFHKRGVSHYSKWIIKIVFFIIAVNYYFFSALPQSWSSSHLSTPSENTTRHPSHRLLHGLAIREQREGLYLLLASKKKKISWKYLTFFLTALPHAVAERVDNQLPHLIQLEGVTHCDGCCAPLPRFPSGLKDLLPTWRKYKFTFSSLLSVLSRNCRPLKRAAWPKVLPFPGGSLDPMMD